MLVDTDRMLTVTEVGKNVSSVISDAAKGNDYYVTKNGKPVAAVVSFGKLEHLETLESDLRSIAIALVRTMSDSGNRTSFDSALSRYGLTEDDLVVADETDEDSSDV